MTQLAHHSTASRTDRPSSGHYLQATGAAFRVANRSATFTKCGQYGDRYALESAFPVGTFFAQYRLRI